jgi:GH15 family glucan-1,4-alpha-glucosidase
MARRAILGNGRLCVGLDEKGLVNDFYYPHVGLHNMTSARSVNHKIGIWVDGIFSWVDDPGWEHSVELDDTCMMARSYFTNVSLGISLSLRDFVDSHIDFFGRVVIVENRIDQHRDVKLYFGQVFQISRAGRADTALYAPATHPYILTYNGNISFVASLRTQDGEPFDQFAVGNYGIEGKSGTYHDAEDGHLSGNLVEHGGVDSVIQSSFSIRPKGAFHVDYWVAASDKNYNSASEIHRTLAKNGLYHYLNSTNMYWKKWLARSAPFIDTLDVKYQSLAKKSLFTIKAHCDSHGGIIASADSSIYNYGRDYYNYVWPRDTFYALSPLLKLGYTEEVKSYLGFISVLIHQRGYVHHKYLPDSSMGSSWHPLMQDGETELNIQEDETAATVLLAIDYIKVIGADMPEAKKLFDKLIKPGATFMAEYFDEETCLPHASYELWEQVFLTSTYTTSIVYKALCEAILIAGTIDQTCDTSLWERSKGCIEGNYKKLFDESNQWFVRGLENRAHGFEPNTTLDISSLYAMSTYGPAKPDDTAVYATQTAVEKYLQNPHEAKGVIRYPGDNYMMSHEENGANPWYVCTLWLGRHYANLGDTEKAIQTLDWTLDHVDESGMLSEQIDPVSGDIRGVTPLVWSHAEYLSLLIKIFKS